MLDSNWGGDDRRATFNAVVWSLNGLSTFAVTLRFVSRTAFGPSKLGLDDFIAVVCVAFVFAASIAASLATESGFGLHAADLSPSQLIQAGKCDVIANFFVTWTFTLPKFAIIALLRRILRLQKPAEYTFWGVAIVNQCGILAISIYWFTRCRPVAKGWNPSLEGDCDPVNILGDLGYAFSSISAFLDVFFALYPIPAIMKLHLSFTKRISICLSLGLGSVACAVSIYKITTVPSVLAGQATDPTWYGVPLVFWALVEADILILTASLATLGPLLRWLVNESPFSKRGSSIEGTTMYPGMWRKNDNRPSDYSKQTRSASLFQTDAIPLVAASRVQNDGRTQPGLSTGSSGGIHKSVQISVSYS